MARKYNVAPEMLPGYRKVPGFGKVSFFDPTTGKHRSSERYYNPALPVDDPNREIGKTVYRQLRRQAPPEVQQQIRQVEQDRKVRRERQEAVNYELAGYVPQYNDKGEIVRKRGKVQWVVPETPGQRMRGQRTLDIPGNEQERLARIQDMRQQISLTNYNMNVNGQFFTVDRSPGGPLARMLEDLGWRPRNAPWMVGQSGSDRNIPGTPFTPNQAMAVWRSQSAARGRIA